MPLFFTDARISAKRGIHENMSDSFKKYLAEFVGTFVLVFIGCGTAIATNANVVATALAFGLSIVVLAYSIGRISGGHVNPAVSLAMAVRGDISWKDFCFYSLSGLRCHRRIRSARRSCLWLQGDRS